MDLEAEGEALSELMRRYAKGDDRVFEALYRLLAPRLHRFCRRLATQRAEADDLFQETFLRLHRARATYVSGGNALPWVFAIARSVYLDRLRYWRRRPEDVGATHDAAEHELLRADERYGPDAQVLAQDLLKVVRTELGKMSEKNRLAYILLKEEGLSVKEAAAVLGTTTDVVKQRAHRAAEQLRVAVRTAGWKEDANDVPREPTRISSDVTPIEA
jgi:RNA polymerase sigma-70 factor, ECF subfamily